MSKKEWMRNNRKWVDEKIRAYCPNIGTLNDSDRWDWIANDESLYLWAKSEGIRV